MIFNDFVNAITNDTQREKIKEILDFVSYTFPFLEKRIAWNQPNFIHQGTFILGLSYAKHHIALAPESVAVEKFKDLAESYGYSTTSQLIRIKWEQTIEFDMIKQIVEFNLEDKKGCTTYWRK